MPSLAIINASGRSDGITQGLEPYLSSLSRLGYSVVWYQCVDDGVDVFVPQGGVRVSGLGFPNRTLDMGANRLWVFPRRLRHLRADIVLLGDPTLARIVPSSGKVLAKIHDLRPLTNYSDRIATRLMFQLVLPRLRTLWRVIAPTNFVRQQLIDLDFDPTRVRVVPDIPRLGYHPDHLEQSLRRISQQKETRVLYVGTDRPYKNIRLVLELAHRIQQRTGHGYRFTLVSRLRRQTQQRIADLGLKNVQVLTDVPSISQVYFDHDVLVFPSLYEGFGRPLIEAMAFGLPILATRIDPVAEIVSNAGILLEPIPLESWVQALASLENPETLKQYSLKSLDRGKAYSLERFEEALRNATGAS